MLNRKIEVFGRIKPASANSQIKDYTVEEGTNDDTLKFSNGKYSSGRRTFRFKKIFRPENSTQEDVFENAAKPIIENVLTGYNGTIFAYGQTGTGKTYTMTGDFTVYKERGIIPRTIQFLFHSLKDTSTVTISYFEIYNEHGYDLIGFQPTTNTVELQQVNVLEDSKGNLHFRNLSAHNVKSVQEALDLLLFGDGNRMVAETMNNLRSSRSHTIFLVTLETMDPESESSIRSTLHLVDLAGSERLGKTGNMLSNSWESRYINLSLHYLEQVLVALGEPGRIHIPYRNSLMTTVLKNSLGGNCCTSMIATFSCEPKDFEVNTFSPCQPFIFVDWDMYWRIQRRKLYNRLKFVKQEMAKSNTYYTRSVKCSLQDEHDKFCTMIVQNETLQTCRFSQRVALVRNEAKINEVTDINKELMLLRRENAYLKDQLRELQASQSSNGTTSPELLDKEKDECYERVKDFIADSHFMNLPLTDSKKAEYCFLLMRNEIMKLKPMKKLSDTSDEFKVLKDVGVGRASGYINYRKYESQRLYESGRNDKSFRRKTETVLRKRRVVMNIPKINVIYKKYKSTESVSGEIINDETDNSQPSIQGYESKIHSSKVSQFSQTSSSLLEIAKRTEISYHSSATTMSQDSEKLEEILEKEIRRSRMGISERFTKRESDMYLFDRLQEYDDRGYDVKSLPASTRGVAELEEEFADNEEDDDDFQEVEKLLKKSRSNPVESDRSSRFSVTGLPLTGDADIDEEIIKFYRARFKKFKSED